MNFQLISNDFESTPELNEYCLENPIWVESEPAKYAYLDEEPQDAAFLHSLSTASKKIKKGSRPLKSTGQSETSTQNSSSSSKTQRCTWRSDEDAQVIELVAEHGQKWTKVAAIMGTRSAKQIRDRYLHKLRTNIQTTSWTAQEDQLLLSLYQKFGTKWAKIVRDMPNRTENQVRNRFNSKFKNLSQSDCSTPELLLPSSSQSGSPSTSFEQFAEEIFSMTPDSSAYSEEPLCYQDHLAVFETDSDLSEPEDDDITNYSFENIHKFIDFSQF